jgi:hypothetical protein
VLTKDRKYIKKRGKKLRERGGMRRGEEKGGGEMR